MNQALNAIKSDLTSRRMLPVLAVLGVALLAALGYALLGGSGKSEPVAAAVPPTGLSVPGPAVSKSVPNANEAVSETTSGTPSHHKSTSRNPFKPLPESAIEKAKKATSPSTGPSTEASPAKSSASGGSSSVTPAPTESTPSVKKTPKVTVYQTSVLFGEAPTPPLNTPLTSYKDLKRLRPMPSSTDPRIAFMGVSSSGKGAIFSLVSEAILHGSAACLPTASQCEAIDLGIGKSEQLEYVEADGQLVVYELQVQSITKTQKASSAAHQADLSVSPAGKKLMGEGQILGLVHMRFSSAKGVLVLVPGHHAFGAKASAARRHQD